MSSRFVYTTYIRTTPTKLWDALTNPEFTKLYWFGVEPESDWKPGSPWKLVFSDGRVFDTGEVVEAEPGKRLVLKWRHEITPELKAEGYTRCTFEITPHGEAVKLSVVHEIERDHSKTIEAVSSGWPQVLSGLKTYLETGTVLELEPPAGARQETATRAAAGGAR